MKRFTFRLEKLLNIKKHLEEEAKLKYAFVLQKKINIENENRLMESQIKDGMVYDSQTIKEGEILDYKNIELSEKYIRGLVTKIKNNNIKKKEIEIELEKLKKDLEKATRERKIIDQLKDRKFQQYKKDYKKHEIKIIDELAGQMINRKHKNE